MATGETTMALHPPTYNATIQANTQTKRPRRRPRAPQAYGYVHCVKRAIGVLIDTTTIVFGIKFSAQWPQRAGLGVAGIIGSFIALLVDASEVVGTLDRSRRISRAPPQLSFCVDFVVLIIFIVGILVIAFSDYHWGEDSNRGPRPWETEMMACFWTLVAGITWRFVYLVWSCIDCCVRKSQRKERRVIYVPVVVENLPPGQPPGYSNAGDEENPSPGTLDPQPDTSTAQLNTSLAQHSPSAPPPSMPPDYASVGRQHQSGP